MSEQTPRDDLVERLRKVESGRPAGDFTTNWYRNPDGPEAADRIERLEAEVFRLRAQAEGHEAAFDGVVQAKIEAETRLAQMSDNHASALRLYSQWRSRCEKAEAALKGQEG